MEEAIAIIRERHQLTIPEQIRQGLLWLIPQTAVKIILINKNRFLVEPYQPKTFSWRRIWQEIKRLKTRGRNISLAEFVMTDRQSH
jgi:bifunctional DNA-binding transcriptional regulator/antitoxin component of YhaV-PrlF toxin-antitoxin module